MLMASLGFTKMDDLIGRVDLLRMRQEPPLLLRASTLRPQGSARSHSRATRTRAHNARSRSIPLFRRSLLQDVGNEKARTLDLAAMLEPAAALRPGAAVRRVRAQDHGLGTAARASSLP